jgi:hypothetical protein
MLEVFRHPDLSHKPVLVPIHASQVTNMRENVLKTVCKLESFNVTETVLHMRINYKLHHPQNLTTQVECITEPALLALLGCQSFDWFQIEVVVKVQVIQVFAVDQ